ncbi:hypothetical protein [Bacillus mojavensis]|uniref:hypothetical protein n=1 Tax=Bacillus mojavensis TaxID=72360 RepID=UPI002DBD0CF7|nr:hypothetical protein [Bacillus mojavensis]MEC1666396.1 hypothetical protein [Bacillus mojavensis]
MKKAMSWHLDMSDHLTPHLNRTITLPETDFIAADLDYNTMAFNKTDNQIVFTESSTFPQHNLVIQFLPAGTSGILDVIKITSIFLSAKKMLKGETTC